MNADTRAVVSVLGCDRFGIVATVAQVLADHRVNIQDISQTIMKDIFTMTMMVDLADSDDDFATILSELQAMGEREHLQVQMQREDVFRYMYRLS